MPEYECAAGGRGACYTENKNSFSYYVRQTIKSCSHTQQEKYREGEERRGQPNKLQTAFTLCVLFVDVVNGKRIPETGG